jgi:hypothetical protein
MELDGTSANNPIGSHTHPQGVAVVLARFSIMPRAGNADAIKKTSHRQQLGHTGRKRV